MWTLIVEIIMAVVDHVWLASPCRLFLPRSCRSRLIALYEAHANMAAIDPPIPRPAICRGDGRVAAIGTTFVCRSCCPNRLIPGAGSLAVHITGKLIETAQIDANTANHASAFHIPEFYQTGRAAPKESRP